MNSVIEKFEGVMMPLAGKISGNRYLLAMRDAFSMLLPFSGGSASMAIMSRLLSRT